MPFRLVRTPAWVAIVAMLATAGCGGSPLSPTEVEEFNALTTVTENFSGSVAVGTTVSHAFAVTKAGSVTLTLTDITPDSGVLVGLGLGGWDGTNCSIQISTSEGKLNEVYQASTSGAGNFCVAIGDPGTFAGDIGYTVKITHP